MRCMLMCMLFFMIFLIIMMTSFGSIVTINGGPGNIKIDNYGHFGGFLTGLLVGLWVLTPL